MEAASWFGVKTGGGWAEALRPTADQSLRELGRAPHWDVGPISLAHGTARCGATFAEP